MKLKQRLTLLLSSFVEVEFDDGEKLQFFLVSSPASLMRFMFVSKDSPIGKAIFGKEVGQTFSYDTGENAGGKVFSGKIVKVE